jgi:mRNA interferase MazF
MEKFEVWTIAGGEHTSKPRPCMIMQSDAIESFDTVIIAPITSFAAKTNDYRIPVPGSPQTGLQTDSFIEAERISAVKKRYLGRRIGKIPDECFTGIDKTIARLLGIAC